MRHNSAVLPPVGDRKVARAEPRVESPGLRARRRTVVLAAAVLAGVLLAVVLLAGWASGGNSGVTDVDGNANAVLYPAGHRPLAPDFTATTLTGSRLSFSSYRGKVVVLNFWGSWCVPCREEAPTLADVAAQYQPSGVAFLGVDVRDTTASAEAFARSFGITYPSVSDPSSADHAGFHRRGADRRDPDHAGDRPHRAHRGRGLRHGDLSGADRDPGEGHREGGGLADDRCACAGGGPVRPGGRTGRPGRARDRRRRAAAHSGSPTG